MTQFPVLQFVGSIYLFIYLSIYLIKNKPGVHISFLLCGLALQFWGLKMKKIKYLRKTAHVYMTTNLQVYIDTCCMFLKL